jgi:hypothetical protein
MEKSERAGIRDVAGNNPPPEKWFYRTRRRSPVMKCLDAKEGAMFDFAVQNKNSVSRRGLYCVWIRAHEGENAPLISMWIDPSMSTFNSQAKVNEPDLGLVRAESEAALSQEGDV